MAGVMVCIIVRLHPSLIASFSRHTGSWITGAWVDRPTSRGHISEQACCATSDLPDKAVVGCNAPSACLVLLQACRWLAGCCWRLGAHFHWLRHRSAAVCVVKLFARIWRRENESARECVLQGCHV
jgi:hypothetical protein